MTNFAYGSMGYAYCSAAATFVIIDGYYLADCGS